jgi:hypothetical protein
MCPSCGVAVFIDLDGIPQLPTSLDESSDTIEEQEPRSDIEYLTEPSADALIEEDIGEVVDEPLSGEDLIDDVLEFANKPTSEVVGSLSYLMVIKGIDTLALKKALLEELRDKKLGWNIKEIEARIESGTLTLKELSTVQATLIAKRFSTLPLIIQWKQIL